MMDRSNSIYERRRQTFERGYTPGHTKVNRYNHYTVIEIDPGQRHSYEFIFDENGNLITTESSGF